MGLQKRIVSKAQQLRVGSQVRLLVDGPSSEHDLVLRARLEGQAPDIDPMVYLTDCDPSEFTAGSVHPGRNRGQPRVRSACASVVRNYFRVIFLRVTTRRKSPSGLVPTFFI